MSTKLISYHLKTGSSKMIFEMFTWVRGTGCVLCSAIDLDWASGPDCYSKSCNFFFDWPVTNRIIGDNTAETLLVIAYELNKLLDVMFD